MYFKNDFGIIYLENGKLYVDTEACFITIDPKKEVHDKFLEEEFALQVTKLEMAQLILPPKNRP
jgi:hypothetical protein|nr:MAG TPA: hypothetical protein [Caudoviricetes sp.]